MADDRGQNIVEIMRHAPGQLPDGLHFGRLCDLALQFRFFAIVANGQQHSRFAEPANAGNAERNRFFPSIAQSHREIARLWRTAGVATHGIGDRRLVVADHQVTRIKRLLLLANACGFGKGLVEEQEPSVAVGQRKTKGQQ